MKVLLTADTVGGVWTYAMELAGALRPHGVDIALATMGNRLSPDQRKTVSRLPNLEVFESEFKLEWMEEPWEDVQRAGEWLLDLQARVRPDVVHLNGYAHGALPWQAPVMVVGHSCVLSWWEAVKREPAPASWDRYRRAVNNGLAAASLVAAPSRAMLDALTQHYGPQRQMRVIANGRDPACCTPGPKQDLVLSAGRLWDEAKNVAALARVAYRVPWPICVAGDDRHPDGSEAQLPRVGLLGKLSSEDLAPWFSRAAVYALPARYEPFGLSALEAGLAGCALVLGDIPSLREVWGEAALFVPPEDDSALAEALLRVIARPAERAEWASRARELALQYTPQRMAGEYLPAYQALIESGVGAVDNAAIS